MDSMGNTIVKCSVNLPKVDCSRSATAAGIRREINHRYKVFQQESLKILIFKEKELKIYSVGTILGSRSNVVLICLAHHPQTIVKDQPLLLVPGQRSIADLKYFKMKLLKLYSLKKLN